jgi:hypothetical protein
MKDRQKWIKVERALIPNRELMFELEDSQFKALTLLVSVLVSSDNSEVKNGVISWDYNERVRINLDIMDTLRKNNAIKSNTPEFQNHLTNHLTVYVSRIDDPNRKPMEACVAIDKNNQNLPILDACVSFVLMAVSGFERAPEPLLRAISDIRLSEELYELKLQQEEFNRRQRRRFEELMLQFQLEEERAFEFSSQLEEARLNDLSWEDLLREQELASSPETKMERHSWEIRSKLIGFNLA